MHLVHKHRHRKNTDFMQNMHKYHRLLMAFTLNEEIFEPKFLFKIACQEWLDLVQKQKLTFPAQDIGLNDWKALKLGENERLTILSPPGYEAAQLLIRENHST